MTIFKQVIIDIPDAVVDDAMQALVHAVQVNREGPAPGSLTLEGLRYEVVDGEKVVAHAQVLHRWIADTIPALVQSQLDAPWKLSTLIDSFININRLSGVGESYEWHHDPNELTVVVYLTDHTPEDGGEFCYILDGAAASITPRRGVVVIMDGREVAHAVAPMRTGAPRISVPVELYLGDSPQMVYSHRDAALYPKE